MAVGDLAFYYTLYLWLVLVIVVSYTDFIALAPCLSGGSERNKVGVRDYGHSTNKGAIIFFRMGGHEKAGGSQNFFMRNRGSQKNQEIIGWLHILMKILFNKIAPKMHISYATRIGVTCFFQHEFVAPEGGHKIFDHQIGGSQKYCRGTFGNS